MSSRQSLLALKRAKIGSDLQHIETLHSSVTTSWGVDWDETFIARDIMQNFFDANRDRLSEVRVALDGPDVTVSAPMTFHLKRLFYLGSEKGPEDIGQYGEGFKAAATCLLRDHQVTPIAASGHDVAVLRVADEAVPGTGMFPVVYDFYRSSVAVPGSVLVLLGCSQKLAGAVTQGLNHFLHENNPLLGSRLWASWDGDFSLYASTDDRGHVFYRKLRRGEFEGIPAVLVIDKEYAAIEKKISKDRDRNAFGDPVMKLFFDTFSRRGLSNNLDGQKAIVRLARPSWVRGHALLAQLAGASHSRSRWSKSAVQEVFGDGYFCRSTSKDQAEQVAIDRLERQWREQGKECLPQYFARFGVLNAKDHFDEVKSKALEEQKRQHRRPPTPSENTAVEVLTDAMRELAPEIAGIFQNRKTYYTVAETQAVLGQLKDGRHYQSPEVFLAALLFTADFAEALAVFLHEHAHIFGYDGSRGFTDALTKLLETVIRCRELLGRYEEKWDEARRKVEKERKEKKRPATDIKDALKHKGEEELRALLERFPEALLRKYCGELANGQES